MAGKRITLKDVAQQAEVSYQTVSKVINNKARVSEETRRQIWKAIERLGYHPNIIGRGLRRLSMHTLGFLIYSHKQSILDPFFNELLTSIVEFASKAQYDVLVSVCRSGDNEIKPLQQLIKTGRVDGLILHATRVNDVRINYLIKEQFPFVAFGRTGLSLDYPCVDVDGKTAIYTITRHLLEKGHHHFAFVGPSLEYFYVRERLSGFMEALKEAGIIPSPEAILLGYEREEGGYKALDCLLTLNPFPSAIVCGSDLIAIGVMHHAYELDLDVGYRPAITGFDGILLSEYTYPSLTTARQPITEVGKYIVHLLISSIEGTKLENPHILLPAEVIIRKSSQGPNH